MGLTEVYNRLPWQIQSSLPILGISGTIIFFQQLLHLNFLEFLGLIFSVVTSFFLVLCLVKFLYRNWLGIWLGHNADLKSLGSWAVVTGATQGIGMSYAFALAKNGMNLVLISRSADKLNQVADEIRQLYNVGIKIIPVDFTGGMEIYKEIETQLANLEVGLLVNNVGMCYSQPEYFSDLPDSLKFCQDLINCNILSVTLMTSLVLPQMVARRKGAVVNVSSITSVVSSPFLSLYGASKAFVDKFTQDLEWEYQEYGIIFQVVIPGYVVTNMSKLKKSSFFVPTPDDFVDRALTSIGLQSRTAVWLPHQLMTFCIYMGYFFRREGALFVTHMLIKQFWFHGKKVMLFRQNNKKLR